MLGVLMVWVRLAVVIAGAWQGEVFRRRPRLG